MLVQQGHHIQAVLGGGGSNHDAGNDGEKNGGAGGAAVDSSNTGLKVGGGSGNPGGAGKNGGYKASDGTGGLLIIYGKSVINYKIISANGSNGGNVPLGATYSGGGASGGGSINIFYKENFDKGTITVTGGVGGHDSRKYANSGGDGGLGTISIGNISSGTYVEYVETDATTE